ncbi:phosphatidylethanolamine-binding protein [Duganella rhizosphaerae]|uniref:YbhB/YbcL family Raf kinase inhibitor-like protein n=1 Tax=Duganella rhizosphaerae TaxID=2885763 RepID=UPI0030E7C491
MKLTSTSFSNHQPIPGEFAFAVIAPDTHITLSTNRNPQLAWDEVPAGTLSFVLICHDPDVPSRGDDVNQEGREVPASLPRVDFFHWLLLDIPGATRAIAAGSHSDGVTPRGKSGPEAADGMKHGINDYSNWFAGDAQMSGNYYGYDGPCPPWNDSLLHHYVFTLYALDIPALPQDLPLDGAAIRGAIAGHVLGEATLTGTYTLNPKLL